ncbi:phage portal protein [Carboxylicivirga sp. RSCT41]|uniref:phage portal protein n=1 Tax=Carboxylicivirga agarovorans TaxID=3417570 RepID=UPI003D3303AD
MLFFDLLNGLPLVGSSTKYGHTQTILNGLDASYEAENITVLYTCVKILSDNFSRLPILVKDENGQVIKDHRISYLFNIKPNGYTNPQTLKSTSEWERNIFGNSFYIIHNDSLEHVSASDVKDWRLQNNQLEYDIYPNSDIRIKGKRNRKYINSKDILHFKGVSNDGVFGLSPLSAAHGTYQLMSNANRTINNFYRNNAMSTLAIERTIPSGGKYENMIADKKLFDSNQSGSVNAGKTIHLSLGEKITPLTVKFADAELIKTLEFSRDTITSLYQIPNYMLSANDTSQNIEQQTRSFVNNTMANISKIYTDEIAFKMFTDEEKIKGYTVEFDLDALIDITFADKITTLSTAISNGIMTPNQVADKLNLPHVAGKWGDYHLVQAQYLPLEEEGKNNPLLKDSPMIDKQIEDKKQSNNLNE